MKCRHDLLWLALLLPLLAGGDCRLNTATSGGGANQGNDLDDLAVTTVTIGDTKVQAWIAATVDHRAKGLMFVQADEMTPLDDGTERGMLFVFDKERLLSFWMKDTIIPLDIAYARTDGTIVKIHTMTPLDLSGYSSQQPARFALEVNAGLFAAEGIREGDVIDIPEDVLNPGD